MIQVNFSFTRDTYWKLETTSQVVSATWSQSVASILDAHKYILGIPFLPAAFLLVPMAFPIPSEAYFYIIIFK